MKASCCVALLVLFGLGACHSGSRSGLSPRDGVRGLVAPGETRPSRAVCTWCERPADPESLAVWNGGPDGLIACSGFGA